MTNRLIAAALAALLAAPAWSGSDSASAEGESTTEAASTSAEDETEAEAEAEVSLPPVPFTEEFLADAVHIDAGRAIWEEQCRHCHGKSAYPGKAPKLKPRKYEPDFVYRRVTDGFRKMPPWKDVYSDEERMQVTAYILSDGFSP